jgi:hypothetical protein
MIVRHVLGFTTFSIDLDCRIATTLQLLIVPDDRKLDLGFPCDPVYHQGVN